YAYPDSDDLSFYSNLIPDDQLKPGQKRLLEVDNPLVVPANTNVRVLVTSTDVIHSWFVPSFGVQEYAIIGRTNESWFNVNAPGTYYGECNQICGVNHAFMPIKVVAMTKPDFEKWLVAAKKEPSKSGEAVKMSEQDKVPTEAPGATISVAAGDAQPPRGAAAPAGH
ncbi:MAG TPA: cytochrome c oxidase subunit II, partial [Stellaceae bacterium]|nr:cytochrome c oxidase subunit II [Stellaceae bacterium]